MSFTKSNDRADESARYLGKAMQFINFIRDIDEDLDLNRTYFPKDSMAEYGLTGLTRGEARRKPEEFKAFIRSQIKVYFEWQIKAELGLRYIPKRMRVAVKTASDMYLWTALKFQIPKDMKGHTGDSRLTSQYQGQRYFSFLQLLFQW